MPASLEASRSVSLCGLGVISVLTGWGLVRVCRVNVWPGGAARWRGRVGPGFQPVKRPASGPTASATAGLGVLGLAMYCLFAWSRPIASQARTARAVVGPALVVWAMFLVAVLVAVAGALVIARLSVASRGTAAFRFPDPVAGVVLGLGLGLAVGGGVVALGAALLALWALLGTSTHAVAGSGGAALNVIAVAMGVGVLALVGDAVRRAVPIIDRTRRTARLSRGSPPFRA